MPAKRKNLIGMKTGHLMVLEYAYSNKYAYWKCRCDCGKETIVRSSHLILGAVKTCGCSWRENGKKSIEYAQKANITHGDTIRGRARLYIIWASMKQRCRNKENKDYGGRGIQVCNDWQYSYEKFKQWAIGNGYNDSLTIDRINVNGNYEPSNCRWVDRIIQANNTSRNVILAYGNEAKTVSQWAKEFGISLSTFHRWIRQGKSIEEISTMGGIA